jgi:Ca2+-transporting ATPase
MNIDWHLLPLSEVSEKLDTSPVLMKTRLINGNPSTVKTRLNIKKNTVLRMVLHQLSNFMILILIVVLRPDFWEE